MAKNQLTWTYEIMMEALDQFKAAHPEMPEKKGFLGWSISISESPSIKLSVSEIGAAAFASSVKIPKDFDAVVDGGKKTKLKINFEIVPLLPSVAPKSGQKKTAPSAVPPPLHSSSNPS